MRVRGALGERAICNGSAPRVAEVGDKRRVAHRVRRALPAATARVEYPQPIYERAGSAVK